MREREREREREWDISERIICSNDLLIRQNESIICSEDLLTRQYESFIFVRTIYEEMFLGISTPQYF